MHNNYYVMFSHTHYFKTSHLNQNAEFVQTAYQGLSLNL